MSANTVTVDTQNFEAEVLNSAVPVVVDFWAPWCGPCRMIGPVLEELAVKYEGRVKVAKVNVDEQQQLAAAFQIQGIPTLYALHNGKVTTRMVGFGGAPALEDLFEKLSAQAAQAVH